MPNSGVTKVGEVANTKAPVPVSSVIALVRLKLDGFAKVVATLVANPLTPVLIGNPVALVNIPDAGVPKAGVINVGEVANTAAPDPVSFVKAVAKLNDVKEPKVVAFPTEVTSPVRLALVVAAPVVFPVPPFAMGKTATVPSKPKAVLVTMPSVDNRGSVTLFAELPIVTAPVVVPVPIFVTAPPAFAFIANAPKLVPENKVVELVEVLLPS